MAVAKVGGGFLLPLSWAYYGCLARAEAATLDRGAAPPAARTTPRVEPATISPTSPRDLCNQTTTPGSSARAVCMAKIDEARQTRMHPPPPDPPNALEVQIQRKAADEARVRASKTHHPELEASQCIQRAPRESASLYGGLANTCDFIVNVSFCTVGAAPGTSSARPPRTNRCLVHRAESRNTLIVRRHA